jgi:hypothetical protein
MRLLVAKPFHPLRGKVVEFDWVDGMYQMADGTRFAAGDLIEIYAGIPIPVLKPDPIEMVNECPETVEFPLPDGIIESDGVFKARCVSCERWTEVYLDESELDDLFDPSYHYCGGSHFCLP